MVLNFALIAEYSLYFSTLGLIIYYRLVFYPLAVYKSKIQAFDKLPPVSIVICAKNELENLKLFLPKVLNQKYPDFEVIVVDDHSTDTSFEWLCSEAKNYPNLIVLKFDQEKISGGKKEALTFGIKNAKHEHLLLTDADCYPASENWITAMISGYSPNKEIILGVGLYESESKNNKLLSNFINWDAIIIAIQYLSFAVIGKPYMSVGRNVSYLKSTFLNNNGFVSHININSGDDDLFIKDAAKQNTVGIVINPNAHTISPAKSTWKSFLHQKSRHQSTGFYYKKSTLIALGLFQILTCCFYVFGIINIFTGLDKSLLLTIVFLKLIVQAGIFKQIFIKIGIRKKLFPFLFFDFLWVILIFYLNIRYLFSNLFRVQKKW